ncbi:hypothetical protein AVEN_162391-1 [Araneus ventricosus]|uniref:Uncharacterized protein n=1 Tax=Araneus ventricosus TaxID=182803 RepID=A0A4Y2GI89_ARAVE|nr:hypothetical protein AVEN_162391-1 [Araneus ventricosus]
MTRMTPELSPFLLSNLSRLTSVVRRLPLDGRFNMHQDHIATYLCWNHVSDLKPISPEAETFITGPTRPRRNLRGDLLEPIL